MTARRTIDLSRRVAPIYGAPVRVRTFHADHCHYLAPRIPAWGHFAIDSVIYITLPLIRTGAGPVSPTVEVNL